MTHVASSRVNSFIYVCKVVNNVYILRRLKGIKIFIYIRTRLSFPLKVEG